MHPFTYMIRPKNFPEASKWSDAEFAEWQHLYREIFRMAKERGLDTYVVFWSIFVSEEFAKAHGVAKQNFYPHYYVPGDTSDITKRYLRESVAQMLEEYPDLDGIGVSHGEGMAGMTPLQRQQFVDEVFIAGALEAKRNEPVKLIHRVPFSSGLSSGPGVSTDVEKITRTAMEKLGDRFEGPIWVEMKFNWSHGHSTPQAGQGAWRQARRHVFQARASELQDRLAGAQRGFLRAALGRAGFHPPAHRARTARRTTSAATSSARRPTSPRSTTSRRVKRPVAWKWAFERQWLFYKLWGRLLYDPATPDAVFEAEFTRRYGARREACCAAYALASNTQLRLASLYDSRWDFTLYSEGFLALQGEHTHYIGVDALINQPTLDPAYVSVADYVKATREGGTLRARIASRRRSSPTCSNATAARRCELVPTSTPPASVADVRSGGRKAWANLGLHLAEKLRGAVALQTIASSGDEPQIAGGHWRTSQKALGALGQLIRITRPLYRDMKLTHYNGNSFDANPEQPVPLGADPRRSRARTSRSRGAVPTRQPSRRHASSA